MQARFDVKVIVFDLGNTLIFSPLREVLAREEKIIQALLSKQGLKFNFEYIKEQWEKADVEVNFPFASHFLQEEPIIQAWLKQLGVPPTRRALLAPEILVAYRKGLKRFLEGKFTHYKELFEILKYLKDIGKQLLVMSNDREFATISMLEWLGIAKYFDHVITSEEVGVEKPDPKIFDRVMDLADVQCKEQVMFVGDDPDRDVAGSKKYGFYTVLFAPPQEYLKSTTWREYSQGTFIEPDYQIVKLSDLKNIVA